MLLRVLMQKVYRSRLRPGRHKQLHGWEQVDKVIDIDQSPIGRTPRSNPATYTGVFDHIRKLFAQVPEAQLRGYQPGRFSFNVRGGRCEHCAGDGQIKIEMHFLPDVYVTCEVCKGRRYNRETLEVRYKGRSIADVLEMSVEEALAFFENIPPISGTCRRCPTSGWATSSSASRRRHCPAARRSASSSAPSCTSERPATRCTCWTSPPPACTSRTCGSCSAVLQQLVSTGNTVLVIEHNLDVIKTADWLIDLGPEGGDQGGRVVATGTPEAVAAEPASHTGRFLAEVLERPQLPLESPGALAPRA